LSATTSVPEREGESGSYSLCLNMVCSKVLRELCSRGFRIVEAYRAYPHTNFCTPHLQHLPQNKIIFTFIAVAAKTNYMQKAHTAQILSAKKVTN